MDNGITLTADFLYSQATISFCTTKYYMEVQLL